MGRGNIPWDSEQILTCRTPAIGVANGQFILAPTGLDLCLCFLQIQVYCTCPCHVTCIVSLAIILIGMDFYCVRLQDLKGKTLHFFSKISTHSYNFQDPEGKNKIKFKIFGNFSLRQHICSLPQASARKTNQKRRFSISSHHFNNTITGTSKRER